MEQALEIKGLCKSYPGFVLQSVNLTVSKGTIVGLIGENGAGKTTLLRAALGSIRKDGGEIKLFGLSPEKKEAREKVAAVFEDSFFYEGMTGNQVGRVLSGCCRGWDQNCFETKLRNWNIPPKKKIKELSRGMRMKLMLASALARQPELLILDEATSGLDPVIRGEILDYMMEFIQDENHAVLISSHITSDLEKVADEIAYLHQGVMQFQRNKDELLEHLAIVKAPKEQLQGIPGEWVMAFKNGVFGNAALVSEPEKVRKCLPEAVMERATLDDMMQFFAQ